MVKRRRAKKVKVKWTSRGRSEGRPKFIKHSQKALNTQASSGQISKFRVKKREILVPSDTPGVTTKLPRHLGYCELTAETSRWLSEIEPGQALQLKCPIVMDEFASRDYPFQIVRPVINYAQGGTPEPQAVIAKAGTLVIYLNEQRVDERDPKDRMIRAFRHLFIIGSGRYVVVDLNILGVL